MFRIRLNVSIQPENDVTAKYKKMIPCECFRDIFSHMVCQFADINFIARLHKAQKAIIVVTAVIHIPVPDPVPFPLLSPFICKFFMISYLDNHLSESLHYSIGP